MTVPGVATNKNKNEKKRAQPGDFERQVDQIRRDIKTVRDNLAAAERALQITNNAFTEPLEETNKDNSKSNKPTQSNNE